MATASDDQTVGLRDVASGARRVTLEGFDDPATNVAISPNGAWLAATTYQKVLVFNVATRTLAHTLAGHDVFATSAAFSPDGALLAVSSLGTITLWDTATWKESRRWKAHGGRS
ncbi:MAG: hypothetical protein FJ029_05740 [Actinobacteria bacterium]|nr:hypothetical protein [Actinomycetota bacterium]